MLSLILKEILLGGAKCSCPSCSEKTATRKVVLSGEALAAVIKGHAATQVQAVKMKALQEEMAAIKRQMWSTIKAATGTEGNDELSLDLDHIDVGIAVLEIPIKDGGETPGDTGSTDATQDESVGTYPDPVSAAA